jgi:hypothetical protein
MFSGLPPKADFPTLELIPSPALRERRQGEGDGHRETREVEVAAQRQAGGRGYVAGAPRRRRRMGVVPAGHEGVAQGDIPF